ncbi:MAG: barstar family protein [Rhodospirillales bacterium]
MLGAGARHEGFHYAEIDCAEVYDKATLLAALAPTLELPDWFDGDWDTLEDCLMDLAWLDAPGYVIVLKDCDALMEENPDDFTVALEVFDGAAAYWHETERPFWVFVGCEDSGEFELPLLHARRDGRLQNPGVGAGRDPHPGPHGAVAGNARGIPDSGSR